MKRTIGFSLLGLLGLAMVLSNSGCGQSAEAAPLEVTYYYLPG